MNSFTIFAVAAACLVAYVSADCAALCSQGCTAADQACNTLPINVECPGLKTMCDNSCSIECQCLDACDAQCPAADPQNPQSVVQNSVCRTRCRVDCGVQLAQANLQAQAAAAKAQLAQVAAKVNGLLSATSA